MAVSFPGRIEAKLVVPTGGASVSASNANGGSAATVTVPAGSFYLTAAGGVSGLLETLQGLLNDNVQGYPQTAAAMRAAVGYGTWTAGWLFDESAGNAAAAFGSPDLTPSGSPVYGEAGPMGGIDKAIRFDTNTEYFTGGDVHNVGATDDLCIAWVGYHTSVPDGTYTLFSKRTASGARWFLFRNTNNSLGLTISDGTNGATPSLTAPLNTWYVGIFVIDRGNGTARGAVCPIGGLASVGGPQSVAAVGDLTNTNDFRVGQAATSNNADTDFKCAALWIGTGSGAAADMSTNIATAAKNLADAINSQWSVSLSDTTGQVTIDWTGYETPTHSLSWTSTTLRDMLGFDANISNATSATTGAAQSPACWLPDAPLNVDGHPAMTPEETDLRVTESPTGVTLGLAGNTKYVHTNVRYRRVPVDRIREADAAVDNASLEVFLRNTQFGQGDISWFTPASPVQIYWNNAGTLTLLGDDANSGTGVAGWTIVGISSFSQAVRLSQDGYVGHFDVTFPRLVSSG